MKQKTYIDKKGIRVDGYNNSSLTNVYVYDKMVDISLIQLEALLEGLLLRANDICNAGHIIAYMPVEKVNKNTCVFNGVYFYKGINKSAIISNQSNAKNSFGSILCAPLNLVLSGCSYRTTHLQEVIIPSDVVHSYISFSNNTKDVWIKSEECIITSKPKDILSKKMINKLIASNSMFLGNLLLPAIQQNNDETSAILIKEFDKLEIITPILAAVSAGNKGALRKLLWKLFSELDDTDFDSCIARVIKDIKNSESSVYNSYINTNNSGTNRNN